MLGFVCEPFQAGFCPRIARAFPFLLEALQSRLSAGSPILAVKVLQGGAYPSDAYEHLLVEICGFIAVFDFLFEVCHDLYDLISGEILERQDFLEF